MALRESLKTRTTPEHRALEGLLGLDRPDLSLEAYREYLRLTHAFYSRLEPQLAESPHLAALGLDMRLRAKRKWLEDDLQYFEQPPVPGEPEVPEVNAGAQAIGCAYVLEGATLGGSVLHGALAPKFDLAPGRGATFLAGYGPRTGAMWRGFIGAIEEAERLGVDEVLCVASASRTFAKLGDWFRAQGWR
jgi:heme oxygenase